MFLILVSLWVACSLFSIVARHKMFINVWANKESPSTTIKAATTVGMVIAVTALSPLCAAGVLAQTASSSD